MANKVYTTPETAIVFTETGGDATFTAKNVANGAGRVSAQFDRGAGAKAMRYRWEAQFKTQANITPGTSGVWLEIYIVTAHVSSSAEDSTIGAADAALTARNQLLNAMAVSVVLPSGTAAGSGPFRRSGVVEVYGRYLSAAFWNATGQTLTNVDGDNYLKLVPMPDEVQ